MHGSELRVMLVEDHPVLREILADFIGSLPQVAACTVSDSAEAALTFLQGADGQVPDVLLADLALPGMNGIDLIRTVCQEYPEVRCGILSAHRSAAYASRALEAGARAYLLKGDPTEIEIGLKAILDNAPYVSRSVHDDH